MCAQGGGDVSASPQTWANSSEASQKANKKHHSSKDEQSRVISCPIKNDSRSLTEAGWCCEDPRTQPVRLPGVSPAPFTDSTVPLGKSLTTFDI